MKLVLSRCSAVGALVMLCVAISIQIQEIAAFSSAPIIVKGSQGRVLSSTAAVASEINIPKPKKSAAKSKTKPKSANKNNKRNPSKKQKGSKHPAKKQKGSKHPAMKEKGSKRVDKRQKIQKSKLSEHKKSKTTPKRNKSKSKDSDVIKTFKPLKDLRLGSEISGKVVDVCAFGAFVNIGYATRGSRAGTALLHISQLSDKKINNIHETLKVGDDITGARVITLDVKKGEVGLSLRKSRPKRTDFAKLEVGSELEGRVDKVLSYGVFVDVGANVNGLLHISRITGGAVENVRHHLNEGDPVSVHIIDIDKEKKNMAVSMLDKKADQYLDRRMSQRLMRFYGSATAKKSPRRSGKSKLTSESGDLEYFDIAIRELEEALKDREEVKV